MILLNQIINTMQNYVKCIHEYNVELCYMDTDTLIIHIKTEDVCEDNENDAEKRFNTSNYGVDRPLPIGKDKKVIGT